MTRAATRRVLSVSPFPLSDERAVQLEGAGAGELLTDDLLGGIFGSFCIGK